MQLALRPYVTTGIAIAGASLITVAPVTVVPTATPLLSEETRTVSGQQVKLTSLSEAIAYYTGALGQLTQFSIGSAGDFTQFAIGGTGDLTQFAVGGAGDLTEFGLGAAGDALQGFLGDFSTARTASVASAAAAGPSAQLVGPGEVGDFIQFLLGSLGQAGQFAIGSSGEFLQ